MTNTLMRMTIVLAGLVVVLAPSAGRSQAPDAALEEATAALAPAAEEAGPAAENAAAPETPAAGPRDALPAEPPAAPAAAPGGEGREAAGEAGNAAPAAPETPAASETPAADGAAGTSPGVAAPPPEAEAGSTEVPAQGVAVPAAVSDAPVAEAGGADSVIEIPLDVETPALPSGARANGGANLVSIALDAVPVADVVNMFSKISGANIIISGTITNAFVTANLKNVEWKAALTLALGSVNLSLIEDPSGILMVVTSEMYKEKLQQIENTKPLVTKSFPVKYLNAVDFIGQVKQMKLLSPRGTIISSQSREQERLSLKSSSLATDIIQNPSITTEIIITDIKEYVDKVENLIRILDKREPQVFIEVRVIDVISDDSKKTGFDWSMLDSFGASLKMQDLKWSFADDYSLVNSAINKDSQFDNRSFQDDINRRYDLEGKEYQETTTSYEEQPPGSGNWVANTVITPTRTIVDKINRGRDISATKTDTRTDTRAESKTATAILSVSDVALFLSFLQTSQNSEMISHPLIVVGNRVEAKIHVGERYPTVTSTKQAANPQQGQTESFSERVEWNDLGITLWVIPEIDSGMDIVRMTVSPQMSTHVKDITTDAGSVYPVISTRQVSTRVNVPSKHTVIIGGLIQNEKGQKEIKVPILGDIPLLGYLFKHNQDVVKKHNLLILLTPTILDERAPLTGLEAVAQQSVDRLEKTPLSPKHDPTPHSERAKTLTDAVPGLTGDVPTTPSSSANLGEAPAVASPAPPAPTAGGGSAGAAPAP